MMVVWGEGMVVNELAKGEGGNWRQGGSTIQEEGRGWKWGTGWNLAILRRGMSVWNGL